MDMELGIEQIENELDERELSTRLDALKQLKEKAGRGEVKISPQSDLMNLHCHTFYSYNAYGYSPSHIAWIGYKNGFNMMGIIDFDVIDGMEEFFRAGEILGLKTVVGIETRVFISEYSDIIINSPNQPGIAYFCGMGFQEKPGSGSFAEKVLEKIRKIARQRNISILDKLNPFLSPGSIDLEEDIVPLTLSGNATERHIIKAYYERSKKIFNDKDKRKKFWSEKLRVPAETISGLFNDEYKLFELMRAKLMKHGGVGYIIPDPGSFPVLDEVIKMMDEMDVLPSYPFLNGTSSAEGDVRKLLELFMSKGVNCFTVIPDRNWNIEDEMRKKVLVEKFHNFMKECRRLNLYVTAGTEMNKRGQKIVDDFSRPELAPFMEDFIRGAEYVYEHSRNSHN